MSTETFTLTSTAQLKALRTFMSSRYGKFKEAIDESDELDEDTIYKMIECFFLDENLYKIMKEKKSTKGESKSRKSKTEKDENKPKRAQSAYMLWLNDNREKIKTDHFTDKDGNLTLEGRDKVTQVAKKAGEIWKTLSDDEKSPYQIKAKELKEQYERDKEAYESSSSPIPQEDTDEDPEKSVKKTAKKAKSNKVSDEKKNSKKTGAKKASSKSTSKKSSTGKGKGKAKAKSNSDDEFKSPESSDNEDDAGPASKSVKFEKNGSESNSSDSDSDSD